MKRFEPPENVKPISPHAVLLGGLMGGALFALGGVLGGGMGLVVGGSVGVVAMIGVLFSSYSNAQRK